MVLLDLFDDSFVFQLMTMCCRVNRDLLRQAI